MPDDPRELAHALFREADRKQMRKLNESKRFGTHERNNLYLKDEANNRVPRPQELIEVIVESASEVYIEVFYKDEFV